MRVLEYNLAVIYTPSLSVAFSTELTAAYVTLVMYSIVSALQPHKRAAPLVHGTTEQVLNESTLACQKYRGDVKTITERLRETKSKYAVRTAELEATVKATESELERVRIDLVREAVHPIPYIHAGELSIEFCFVRVFLGHGIYVLYMVSTMHTGENNAACCRCPVMERCVERSESR